MVRAILEGKKTQTRRVVKNQPKIDPQTGDWLWYSFHDCESVRPIEEYCEAAARTCPYGQPGDRLWVRETFGWNPDFPAGISPCYRADKGHEYDGIKWRPSIHMPREASRITLEVTGIWAERLQDISEADAVAEGIEYSPKIGYFRDYGCKPNDPNAYCLDPRRSYFSFWDSIYGAGAAAKNPYVWTRKFKIIAP